MTINGLNHFLVTWRSSRRRYTVTRSD